MASAVTLTGADLAYLLASYLVNGWTYEQLGDDERVRGLVAGSIVNNGCTGIEQARDDAGVNLPLPDDDDWWEQQRDCLAYCRRRVTDVFGCPAEHVAGVTR